MTELPLASIPNKVPSPPKILSPVVAFVYKVYAGYKTPLSLICNFYLGAVAPTPNLKFG